MRKHQLLEIFSSIIYAHDPMGLKAPDEDEYDVEALSILARFAESAFHVVTEGADLQVREDLATMIVERAFKHWFMTGNIKDSRGLARALLGAYLASYPQREQAPADEVPSEP